MIPGRFLSVYYVVNMLAPVLFLAFVYPSYRSQSGFHLKNGFTPFLSQEQEWAAMIFGNYVLKYRNHSTLDESVQKFFMHLKMLTVALCFGFNKSLGFWLIAG